MTPPFPFDPEQLLAHEGYVRALARVLVHDEHRADDVAQEAWLVALRRVPRNAESLRAWLAGIVRRVAWRAGRTEQRRPRREREGARPEAVPSTAELLERESARRLVVDATLALEEPYRSAIVLRFLEDLPPRAIASRLDVPVETVRTRVRRGLEMVRSRLDRAHDGDRSAWCAALAPLAGLSGGVGALAGPLSTAAVMTMKLKVSLAAAALLLVSIGLWQALAPPPAPASSGVPSVASAPPAETPVSAPAAVGAGPASMGPGAGAPRREALPADPGSTRFENALATLTGRVVETDGRGVEGAAVELLGGMAELLTADFEAVTFGTAPEFLREPVLASARTDAAGRFRLERIDPRAIHLLAVNSGRPRPLLRLLEQRTLAGTSTDVGDLVLPPERALAGRAVDESGRPLAGARVRASNLPGIAYQGGAARVRPGVLVVAQRENEGATAFELPAWTTRLLAKLPIVETTTAADGSFTLAGLPDGALHVDVAASDRPVRVVGPLPAGGAGTTRDLGEIRIGRGETLTGIVVDADGRAVTGVEVAAGPLDAILRAVAVAASRDVSDANGRFSLAGLEGSKVRIATRRTGTRPWSAGPFVDLDGDECRIVLEAARSFVLRVSDEEGQPLTPEILVRAAAFPLLGFLPGATLPEAATVEALEPGRFRVGGLRSDDVEVFVRASGHALHRESLHLATTHEDVTVRLEREHRVSLRVVDGDDPLGAPLPRATVFAVARNELARLGAPGFRTVSTNASGAAEVRGPAGRIALFASHPAFALGWTEVDLPREEPVVLRLTQGGSIAGVVARGGVPDTQPRTIALDPVNRTPGMPSWTLSDAEGRFHFPRLAPGSYQVHLFGRAFDRDVTAVLGSSRGSIFEAPLAQASIEVREGEVADVILDLGPRATTADGEGRVVGTVWKNGSPLRGVQVICVSAANRSAATDSSGQFVLASVPSGRQELYVFTPGRGSNDTLAGRPVDVVPNAETTIEIRIETAGPLRGVVVERATGRPVAGASVHAMGAVWKQEGAHADVADSSNVVVEADASGAFLIPELPALPTQVFVTAEGFASAPSVEVLLEVGREADALRFELDPGCIVIGRVERAGGAAGPWGHLDWMPAQPRLGAFQSQACRVDPATGAFTMKNLRPGRYRVTPYAQESETLEDGSTVESWSNDRTVEPLVVTVEPGENRDVVLRFAKAGLVPPPAPPR